MIVRRSTYDTALAEARHYEHQLANTTEALRKEELRASHLAGALQAAKTRAISVEEELARALEREKGWQDEVAVLRDLLRASQDRHEGPSPAAASLNALNAVLKPDLTPEEITERDAKREKAMDWAKGFMGRMDAAWGSGMSYDEAKDQPGFTLLSDFGDDE